MAPENEDRLSLDLVPLNTGIGYSPSYGIAMQAIPIPTLADVALAGPDKASSFVWQHFGLVPTPLAPAPGEIPRYESAS